MRDSVKKFIEDHIECIESCDFKRMYEAAVKEIPFQVGNLSWNLMQAGIDPLEGLNMIPSDAFSNSLLKEFTVPDRIVVIGSSAFMESFELTKVSLPSSIKAISISAFKGCYELDTVEYRGTKEQFMNMMVLPVGVFIDCSVDKINCSDGNILITPDGKYIPEREPIIL